MPRDTKLAEIMTTDVITVTPDTGIEEAATTMADAGVGGLPVVDGDGNLMGMLSDEHIIVEDARLPEPSYVQLFGAYIRIPGSMRRFEEEFKKAAAAYVSGAMNSDPRTASVDDTVEDAATIMIEERVNRLPIVDADRKLLGIVTRVDLVRAISRS